MTASAALAQTSSHAPTGLPLVLAEPGHPNGRVCSHNHVSPGQWVANEPQPRTLATSTPPDLPRFGRKWYDKDVLKTGRWRVGGRIWTVTRAVLHRLAANWRLARLRGVRVPVVWNHSHDARDQIGELTRVYVVGNTLRACFWAADPDDVRKLGITVNHVSAEVHEPWFDGQGNRYDLMLVHVGVVNLPVIAAQQPFKRLRLMLSGERTMENESLDHETATEVRVRDQAQAPVDIQPLRQVLNALLDSLGTKASLPEDTTWDNLLTRLESLTPSSASALSLADVPADADSELERLRAEYQRVRDELLRERENLERQRRQTFLLSLDQLLSEGRISSADRAEILSAAAPANYSLGILAPFQRIPAGASIPTQRRARVSASAAPPDVADTPEMSRERAAEVARSFRK